MTSRERSPFQKREASFCIKLKRYDSKVTLPHFGTQPRLCVWMFGPVSPQKLPRRQAIPGYNLRQITETWARALISQVLRPVRNSLQRESLVGRLPMCLRLWLGCLPRWSLD